MTRKAVAVFGAFLAFGFATMSVDARAADVAGGTPSPASPATGIKPPPKASADNIVVAVGGTTVRISHIEVVGSSLTNADVAAFFATSDAAVLEDKLRKLDAATIVIPEITVDSTEGSASRHLVQTQILLADVQAGRAAVASGANASLALKDETGTFSLAVGATTAKGVDLAAILHVAAARRPATEEPLRALCDDLAVNAVTLSGDAKGREPLTIATVRETGLKARPLKSAIVPPGSTGSLDAFDDLAHSLSADLVEADDIAFMNPASASADELKRLAIRHVALRGLGGGRLARFELNGLEAQGNEKEPGKLALASATVDEIASHGAAMPSIDKIDLRDFAIDIPTNDPSKSAAHVALTVKRAGYDARGLVIGKLPRNATLTIEHAVFDVPPDSSAAPILLAMGYQHLDLSADSTSRYDPTAQTLNLDRLAVSGVGMGSLDLKLALADVSEAVVSQDDSVQRRAAAAMRVKTIAITLRNDGLIDKAIGFKAAIDGLTVAEERRNLDQLVATGLVGFGLQESAKAQAVVAALRKFLADPKTLRLEVGSKTGVGLDAMQRFDDPKAFLDTLDVEAAAD